MAAQNLAVIHRQGITRIPQSQFIWTTVPREGFRGDIRVLTARLCVQVSSRDHGTEVKDGHIGHRTFHL